MPISSHKYFYILLFWSSDIHLLVETGIGVLLVENIEAGEMSYLIFTDLTAHI